MARRELDPAPGFRQSLLKRPVLREFRLGYLPCLRPRSLCLESRTDSCYRPVTGPVEVGCWLRGSEEADVTLYVVAGEAMLNLGGRQQAITPGWFSVVPRGTPHTITRRGRTPAILLSVVAGPVCGN